MQRSVRHATPILLISVVLQLHPRLYFLQGFLYSKRAGRRTEGDWRWDGPWERGRLRDVVKNH